MIVGFSWVGWVLGSAADRMARERSDAAVCDDIRRSTTMTQRLFIGGVSFGTATERLPEPFDQIDRVRSVSIVIGCDTGRSRGFGFVEVATGQRRRRQAERCAARRTHAPRRNLGRRTR